jgi:hypothetical protein
LMWAQPQMSMGLAVPAYPLSHTHICTTNTCTYANCATAGSPKTAARATHAAAAVMGIPHVSTLHLWRASQQRVATLHHVWTRCPHVIWARHNAPAAAPAHEQPYAMLPPWRCHMAAHAGRRKPPAAHTPQRLLLPGGTTVRLKGYRLQAAWLPTGWNCSSCRHHVPLLLQVTPRYVPQPWYQTWPMCGCMPPPERAGNRDCQDQSGGACAMCKTKKSSGTGAYGSLWQLGLPHQGTDPSQRSLDPWTDDSEQHTMQAGQSPTAIHPSAAAAFFSRVEHAITCPSHNSIAALPAVRAAQRLEHTSASRGVPCRCVASCGSPAHQQAHPQHVAG